MGKKENGSKDIQDGEDAGNLIAAIIFTSIHSDSACPQSFSM